MLRVRYRRRPFVGRAREPVLPALYAAASQGLPTLADAGYDGTRIGVHTPIKQPTENQILDATTAPTTRYSAACAASVNADSPC